MGRYDFTYELPENFHVRVLQILRQSGKTNIIEAFQRCRYEPRIKDYAYYHGFRGDNWNKKAVDCIIEGRKNDIFTLQSARIPLKDAIEIAINPNETGFLVDKLLFLETDIPFENPTMPLSNEERLKIDITTANMILDELIEIGRRGRSINLFDASTTEDRINDCFREALYYKGYIEIKDQTRHGISETGKDAGEVDILLTKDGKEIGLFEGLKLSTIDSLVIDRHIKKAVSNYNVLGTATFIVAYVSSADFVAFWERYFYHIEHYEFPFPQKEKLRQWPYHNAITRAATLILSNNGFDFPVYFIALKIN